MLETYCPEVEVVGLANGVESALVLFEAENPELVFLDIRMPSGTEGFDFLKRLGNRTFYVVFVTAFKDYAIRAFENRALHYILKPIDEKDRSCGRYPMVKSLGLITSPPDNGCWPIITFSRVDFPAPFFPTSPTLCSSPKKISISLKSTRSANSSRT